jgi:type II secretory ATPase GspE/PulE/Tfp pilus assembly ATPase PilB-like protein
LRINVIPTMHGEDMAMRLLVRDSRLFVLENLGMTRAQLGQYQAMIESRSGLILITGPTGSGKSATLYSSLVKLATGSLKINTIENPIEYAIDGLRQSQVNPATGLSFAELLRAVLRQSPDVIMVGEVRDAETAQTAVHAANSGVLVFATVHAPGAAGAVQTMMSYGVNPQFLSASLRGLVSQRLVRTLCPNCRLSFDISDAPMTFDEIRPLLASDQGKTLYAANGCDACGQSGYSSRTGVFEVLPISSAMRRLVSDCRPVHELRAKAREENMLSLRQAALLKVAAGITCTEELFRAIPPEELSESGD